ncbi:Gp15 family bacteriophage protein [Streptococcus marmotae]|uniref:Gp15 family bacteriophage protein n=1 Tax=Streptococcus marmotae TaxID=1825069 RepID=UPI000833AA51|nr:Gp15 family bacteriophage protein [Streptococcus marmotae]QBX16928.1 hypothetical protein Javan291_0052 [Streptococcus phage Javan291]
MLDLSKKLKDELVIEDRVYALDLSFNKILLLFEMLQDEDIPDFVKPHFALRMLTGVKFDELSVEEAVLVFQAVFEEHIQVRDSRRQAEMYDLAGNVLPSQLIEEEEKPLFNIKQDTDYIYASFLQAYGIDLIDVQGKLHWKKFNALLSGLPKDTKFAEVMKIRSWRPQEGESKEYQSRMRALQEEYALKESE